MFWGLSPALDLQEEYYKYNNNLTNQINILLIGSCDVRHVLKTLAQAYRHKKLKLNIYIIDGCLELVARQLLLLSIALEHPDNLGLLEKTRLFLEIYGNSLIRMPTSKYMIFKAKHLIEMITNLNYMSIMMPCINIEGIKYKERDYIEMLMKFWTMGNTNKFEICAYWDKRVRRYLGTRYDSKHGVFDWDYHMRFKDIGGDVVSSQEYQHFRNSGVSFVWLDTEVSRPNYTLAAGVIKTEDDYYHREYIGDIITGPYIAYGLDCDDKDMLEKCNGIYKKRATDISERNIMRILYEIQHQCEFNSNELLKDKIIYDLGKVTIAEPTAVMSSECESTNVNLKPLPLINLDFVDVSFHSPAHLDYYCFKKEFQKKFDVVFVSHNYFEHLKPHILNMLNINALIVFETKKFILDLKKDDIKKFSKKIKSFANENGLIQVEECDDFKDSFIKYQLKNV